MFVAVVVRPDLSVVSRRDEGDFSCFLGKTKSEAVNKAIAAKARWDGSVSYRVLVSKLTIEAIPTFTEVKL